MTPKTSASSSVGHHWAQVKRRNGGRAIGSSTAAATSWRTATTPGTPTAAYALSEQDPYGTPVAVVDQLRFRAAVARASLPHHLVDTDQWPMPDHRSWLEYVAAQEGLGVPALYYAERMDRTDEPVTADDLAVVAASWASYRATLR